jgi:hypothetical protein
VEEFQEILSEEGLTVEGLLYRVLLAETQGLKTRADERRRSMGDDRGRSSQT